MSATRPLLVALSLAVIAGACGKGLDNAPASTTAAGTPPVATGQDSVIQALVEANRLKDSLLQVVFETDTFMDQIGQEVAKVKSLSKGMTPTVAGEGNKPADLAAYRASLVERVKEMSDRLNQAEAKLVANRKRMAELSKDNAYLKDEVSGYQNTIANFTAKIDRQQAAIDSLYSALGVMTQEKETLAQEKAVLTDTVSALTTRENTVYYVVGTKDELKAKGLVVQEGGKFLFFGKKSWQPARDLESTGFQSADLRELNEVALPDPTKEYRIVSRQDLTYVETTAENKGKFTGAIKITSPREFWATSKYLIVMED